MVKLGLLSKMEFQIEQSDGTLVVIPPEHCLAIECGYFEGQAIASYKGIPISEFSRSEMEYDGKKFVYCPWCGAPV